MGVVQKQSIKPSLASENWRESPALAKKFCLPATLHWDLSSAQHCGLLASGLTKSPKPSRKGQMGDRVRAVFLWPAVV